MIMLHFILMMYFMRLESLYDWVGWITMTTTTTTNNNNNNNNTFLKCWIKWLYYWGDEIKDDKMGGACDTHEKRNLDRHLVEKPDWKNQLGRLRCR